MAEQDRSARFAIADAPPSICTYHRAGVPYEVVHDYGSMLCILSDGENPSFIKAPPEGCPHLLGKSWRVVAERQLTRRERKKAVRASQEARPAPTEMRVADG